MKILVACDSFKNCLSSKEIGSLICKFWIENDPTVQIDYITLADGGEGSLNALEKSIVSERIYCNVLNPLFERHTCYFLKSGESAFIEMAKASGLELIDHSRQDCLQSSTYGTGQLIKQAVELGLKEIFLFAGGSATHDLGIGMAEALGFRFYSKGKELKRLRPSIIKNIDFIEEKGARAFLSNISFNILSDVNNPLTGPKGAANTYAAQKGANEKERAFLEECSLHVKNLVKVNDQFEGAGAAGGLGYGARFFLKAKFQSGIDFLVNQLRMKEIIKASDLIITGEGSIDDQSISGKLVYFIAKTAAQNKKPCLAICAINQLENISSAQLNLTKIYALFKEAPKKIDIAETILRLKETIGKMVIEWKNS